MITQNLFNKKPKTFMDYEPGKVPSQKDRSTQTKAETKAYDPFGSNIKLVGDNITEKDYYDFLEGFSDPYGEKREQERRRKEKFANIRTNADNRNRYSQSGTFSQAEPFLEGFNKEKTTSILNPHLPYDTNRSFELLGTQERELKPAVQRLTSAPAITNAVNRNPNTQIHAKPQNNNAFLKGFNYPNGEMERWEEEKASNPNGFQPNVLGIAPMGREGRMWCWIAAASMVDEYYHPESSSSQQEIANQLGKGRRDGGYIEETSELGKGSRSCTTSGFSDRISASELTYEKIQEEMQGKHPIVLLTETGDRYESEHYVVIVGCYTSGNGKKYVVVNETREEKTSTGINGVQRHIPYEQLKGVFSTGRGKDQRIKAFYTTRPEKDSYHK